MALSSLAVSACYSPYDLAQPIDMPENAIESAVNETAENPLFEADGSLSQDWWSIFNDDQLTDFIETALEQNPTFQAAEAQIFSAMYQADKLRASLYPYIAWAADVQRQKLTKTGVFPTSTPLTPVAGGISPAPIPPQGIPFYFTQYETALDFKYDFDLWGKKRNALRAAIGEMKAKMAEEAFSRLALSISVAQAYFQLQIDYERLKIAEALAQNREKFSNLTEVRVQGNLESNIPHQTARTNVANAKQLLLQIQANAIIHENQLKAYLAGNFEDEIHEIHITEKSLPKIPLPRSLPLHLLSNRPDIMAQIWLIGSAGRRIQVAKAGFYPDINLMGYGGFQTIHLKKLFEARSGYGNLEMALTLPIFDGGFLEANLKESEVNYDLAIYQYNQLVLTAAKEVLNGISLLQNAKQQFDEYKSGANYQNEIFRLTKLRIKNNLNSTLDYLRSEQESLLAQEQEIIAFGNLLDAQLQLIKALGGGYDCDE